MIKTCSTPLLAVAVVFPISLLGDTFGTVTLTSGTELNFSTGATGSSGGDILWNGNAIEFVDGAKGYLIAPTDVGNPLNFSLGLADVQAYAKEFSNGLQSSDLRHHRGDWYEGSAVPVG